MLLSGLLAEGALLEELHASCEPWSWTGELRFSAGGAPDATGPAGVDLCRAPRLWGD